MGDNTTTGDPAVDGTRQYRRQAIRGTVWVLLGFGAGQVLRIVSSVVLTRFLHPEVYGLMDLVNVVIVALALFSDVGIAPAIVQNPRGEEKSVLDTAWTMKVIRGVVLFVAALLLSGPVARFYDRPILLLLLCALGVTVLMDGFGASGILVLVRRLQRGRIVLFELARDVTVLIGTIAGVYLIDPVGFMQVYAGARSSLAFNESLVWAVVLGTLAGSIVYLVLGYVALPFRWSRLSWDRGAAKEILSFGKWVFLSTILTFLVTQTDRLIVPKVADFTASGLYGRAAGLAAIPIGLSAKIASSVVLPLCSRNREAAESSGRKLSEIYLSLGVLNGALMAGLIACAPAATRVLYPAAYADVGWLTQILAVGAWMRAQSSVAGCALMGFNQRTSMVVPNVVKLIAMVVLVWPSIWLSAHFGWGEVVGVVIGFSLAEFAFFVVMRIFAARIHLHTVGSDLLLTFLVFGTAVVGQFGGDAAFRLMDAGATPEGRWAWLALFVIRGVLVVVLWGAVAGLFHRMRWIRIRYEQSV